MLCWFCLLVTFCCLLICWQGHVFPSTLSPLNRQLIPKAIFKSNWCVGIFNLISQSSLITEAFNSKHVQRPRPSSLIIHLQIINVRSFLNAYKNFKVRTWIVALRTSWNTLCTPSNTSIINVLRILFFCLYFRSKLNEPDVLILKKVHLLAKTSTFIFSAEWILHFVHAFDKILLVENGRWGG